MKGLIINRSYEEIDSRGYVFLFGRLENNESFAIMNEFSPYFFIREKDLKSLKKIELVNEIDIEKTNLKNFREESVLKLMFKNQKQLKEVGEELREFEVETFEQDLKPAARFMIERNIFDSIEIEGDFEKTERVDRFYKNPKISPCKSKIKPKVVSIDIESGKGDSELYCIGLYGERINEVLMITSESIEGVTSCKNERECLEKFKERIHDIDPDIITGWNVIDFDLIYLKKLFDENNIVFDIGRTNKGVKLRIEKNFLKSSSAEIPGRIVLDGLNMIKDPFIKEAPTIKNIKFESYTLEEVAEQIINKTKLITGKNRHDEICKLYNGDKKQKKLLAEYNIQDCKLVYEILEKTDMVKLSMERAGLTGMPLDRLTASIASFDSLYIRKAREIGYVSPSNIFKNKPKKITGGFVMTPKPGLYHNVLVLDFKSLYPSIIKTFNIDPKSYLEEKQDKCIESPNGACFKNEDGILPEILGELHLARENAKKEKRELSSYAIKIIMNSFFGVLASPNSRYFNMKIGNAITTFGQEIIKLTAKKIEEKGLNPIYQDTDSCFIDISEDNQDIDKIARELPKEINEFYRDYVKKKFSRKSFLELEFDKHYLSLLIPQTRLKSEERGAKKRYAGLLRVHGKEVIDIVGLEAIRGDWTEAAQDFQRELLLRVFKKQEIIQFIRNYIKNIESGKLDEKLIYRKSIRKDLKEYVKTTPPHVKAARKLEKLDGNRIEYYITNNGPEPIQNLKSQLDYDHYIEKQIKPIAKTILETIGIDPEKAFSKYVQEKLF